MKRDDGGPAFPRPANEDRTNGDLPDGNDMVVEQEGMSLRDWFAGRAMAGILGGTKSDVPPVAIDPAAPNTPVVANVAAIAYRYADAMLAARTARPAPTTPRSPYP